MTALLYFQTQAQHVWNGRLTGRQFLIWDSGQLRTCLSGHFIMDFGLNWNCQARLHFTFRHRRHYGDRNRFHKLERRVFLHENSCADLNWILLPKKSPKPPPKKPQTKKTTNQTKPTNQKFFATELSTSE